MSDLSKEQKQKLMAAAKELDKELKRLGPQAQSSAMEMGWIAAEVKRNNFFEVLGYKKEDDYRKNLNIERSTWYRYIRIAEAYKPLSKKVFLTLMAGKAEIAMKYLSEAERCSDEWVRRLQKNGPDAEELEKMLVKTKAKNEGVDPDDLRVTFKITCLESQRNIIESCIRKFQAQHNLADDDKARALELICVEVSHGESILAVIRNIVPEARTLMALYQDSEKSAEETLEVYNKKMGDILLKLAEAAGIKINLPKQQRGNVVPMQQEKSNGVSASK